MTRTRSFWINLSLVNLCIVAFLGFGLRSKILFPIHFINYRNLLSAHSHFAFAGWAGLSLMVLLIYDLLPDILSRKKIYQWILTGIEVSSLGMALMFPFYGYNAVTLFFSTLYIVMTCVFVPVFIKDMLKTGSHRTVKLLGLSALACLVISFLGTLGLVSILVFQSGDSLLYRDSIYLFLHFQYNGFFTLSIFALFLNYLVKKGIALTRDMRLFALFLCLSVAPALFLSLLWHNNPLFYALAGLGCVFIVLSLVCFFRSFRHQGLFSSPVAKMLWLFSVFSFGLKMLLNVGTILPQLGDAIYGDRPVIIGFLHLVFLGFVTFYLLSTFIENGYFIRRGRPVVYPFVVFSLGIIANEVLLMVQGLSVLLNTNNEVFKWLLWGASILLFAGSLLIAWERFSVVRKKAG